MGRHKWEYSSEFPPSISHTYFKILNAIDRGELNAYQISRLISCKRGTVSAALQKMRLHKLAEAKVEEKPYEILYSISKVGMVVLATFKKTQRIWKKEYAEYFKEIQEATERSKAEAIRKP